MECSLQRAMSSTTQCFFRSFSSLSLPPASPSSSSSSSLFVNLFSSYSPPHTSRQRSAVLRGGGACERMRRMGRSRRGSATCSSSAAASSSAATPTTPEEALQELMEWLAMEGFPEQAVKLSLCGEEGIGAIAKYPIQAGDVALKVPESYTVTSADVANHPVVAQPAAGLGDLIGLTLWFIYERAQKKESAWWPFINTFPHTTLSPLLWTEEEQEQLLKGCPSLEEIKQRVIALKDEFQDLQLYFEKDPEVFPPDIFSFEAFKTAFAVVLSRTTYLPAADLFALVPYADAINHRGDCQAYLDYSMEDQSVVLQVDKNYKQGDQVFASYGQERPNYDLLISYGFVDESSLVDYVELEVGLVEGDRLQALKQQVLQLAGYGSPQTFPLYADRFPTQLLTYMRLVRLQDPALFSKVIFDRDVILDQANEYEVLMILMGECRSRLGNYEGGLDDELRLLKNKKLSSKERVAAQLRLSEKTILSNTMTALRNRLAPIRGIPTKGGGLKDPNADINEMFDMVEQVASAPAKFLTKFLKG
ncbi:unnamed protein product [Sphagnum troendelagicum]|uniref:Rubisco LSMT substrate-binding domain-containing protein n=1 Tax=Sphagnum troendelagicum TaxID=128251 RepID=A0ABP0U0G2_9BRYO